MITIDEIKQQLLKGERLTLECKKAQSNVPNDVWKTYSSFANTYAGEETRARNQRIQNMFRMIGFGENLGSGFPLILSAWNEKHWLKPELIEQRELLQVKLVLTIETKNETANAPVNASAKLNKTQAAIVNALLNNNSATYDDLSAIVGVHRTTIMRNISTLKKKSIIRRVGENKNGHWEILTN